MVALDFIFRLVHYSSEDVSFNSIYLNVLKGIKQFYLLMWFKKTRLETPFKSDNVKALVKTSNSENLMIGLCKFMTANETRDLMWMGSPIQNNC